jgi:hypothetical protein
VGKSIQVWWLFLNCGFALLATYFFLRAQKEVTRPAGRNRRQNPAAKK